MSNVPHIDIPHGDEVTTEPQRLALEAMSHDLVVKLNAMVAEQEHRAREFAAQQHSLSSLPSFSVPEVSSPALPQMQQPPTDVPTSTRGVKARMSAPVPQAQPTITNGPRLPEVPPSRTRQQARTAWDEPGKSNSMQREYKMPTIIREPDKEKKEGSIGAGTIAFIIFIVFFLVMRGCN